MTTTALPTRLRTHIRDHITSPTSALSIRTSALTTTLGYPVQLDPEWGMLWKTLQPRYPDQATFIPSIANVLVTWCEAFTAWLEGEENEGDVDKLLDDLKQRGRVEVVLEIATTGSRPVTAWRADKLVFVVSLPKADPLPANTLLAGFSSDFLTLFTTSPRAPEDAEDPESWADLSLPEVHTIAPSRPAVDIGEDTLPDLATIPRPEELLKKPPYWLVVRQEGRARVVIQGSHTPSLACLEAYLKRWCRGDVGIVDRPPMVEIRLQQSAFGLGLLNDTLVLETTRGREVSAMLVLVVVERVLGYVPVLANGAAGSVWEFKRMKGFK